MPGGCDLGTLELPEELQRKGILTRFLVKYDYLPLRIQNVLNSDLERWLLRQSEWEAQDADMIGLGASYINAAWRAGLLTRNVREYA